LLSRSHTDSITFRVKFSSMHVVSQALPRLYHAYACFDVKEAARILLILTQQPDNMK